jgi:hypothetical protein
MNLSNSKVIIGAFQTVGKILDGIADLMSNVEAQIPVFAAMGVIAVNALGSKLREHQIAKELNRLSLEEKLLKEEEYIRAEAINRSKETQLLLEKQKGEVAQADALIAKEANNLEIAQIAEKQAAEDEAAAAKQVAESEAAELRIQQQIDDEIALAQAAKKLILEQQLLQTQLQRKAANGEITAEEQAQLNAIAGKIAQAKAEQKTSTQKIANSKKELKSQKEITKKEKEALKTAKNNLKTAKQNTKEAEQNLAVANDKKKTLEEEHKAELQKAIDKSIEDDRELSARQKQLELMKEQAGQTSFLGTL